MTALSTQDLAIDHTLAEIALSFRFLLDLTPIDADVQRAAFAAGAISEPEFTYRELAHDPDVTAEMVNAVDLGAVGHPVLASLLRDKQRTLTLQVEMLRARNSADFLPLSLELFGGVAPALRDRAVDLLDRVPVPVAGGPATREPLLDAEAFMVLARNEVEEYRALDPDIAMHVALRPDVAGILVSGGELLVAETLSVPVSRADALIQHEVGTHMVTFFNGSRQPVQLLAAGLAGYEETQEGLAILGEFLVGGLSAFRMRQLAARVIAVDRMVAGDPFSEVHGRLVGLGFSDASAFSITMRAFRGGGFTKDAIYLRGLLDLVEHLGRGGALDSLWLGRFSLRDLPLVEDLSRRGLLVPPRVLPRYLARPETVARLDQAAHLTDIADMIARAP